MNIIEIPVIGSRRSEKERLFTTLSDQPLRKFEGLDVGFLPLDENTAIYLYFLNQENDEYYYLWDLIIPRAIASIVICDIGNNDIFEKNVEIIEKMKLRYATDLIICSLPVQGEEPAVLRSKGLAPDDVAEFLYFDPDEKKSAKEILFKILDNTKLKINSLQ